jgi:anti-sigma factor RsiW
MRGSGVRRGARAETPDRIVWQRGRTTDAVEDDAARFLDLAAFADGTLDPDERERVAAWLVGRPEVAADVAAARMLAGAAPHAPPHVPPDEAVVARACAILGDHAAPCRVIALRRKARPAPILPAVAHWGSLAAALVVAGWLGFALGMDASATLAQSGLAPDDGAFPELLAPAPNVMRDLTGGA